MLFKNSPQLAKALEENSFQAVPLNKQRCCVPTSLQSLPTPLNYGSESDYITFSVFSLEEVFYIININSRGLSNVTLAFVCSYLSLI